MQFPESNTSGSWGNNKRSGSLRSTDRVNKVAGAFRFSDGRNRKKMNTTLDMVGRTNSKPKPDNTISSIANVTQNFFSIRADSRNERNNELRQTGKFNYLLAQEDKMRNKTNNAPNISSDRSHPSGNQSKSLYRHNLRLQR